MCQYITHPCWPRLPHNPLPKPASPHRSPLSPRLSIYRTNKVHRYESSVFRRCSHPIPHLRLSIPSLDPPLPSPPRGSLLFRSSLSSPRHHLDHLALGRKKFPGDSPTSCNHRSEEQTVHVLYQLLKLSRSCRGTCFYQVSNASLRISIRSLI